MAYPSRAVVPALLALSSLVAACGGVAVLPSDGSGGAGGSTGGAGGSAGGAGGTSTGGATSLPPACTLPADPGSCNAYMPSYFHDAATGVCQPFVYGGCGGNENRYPTLEACQDSCGSTPGELDSCASPTDCILRALGCCGVCGQADAASFVAVNRGALGAWDRAHACGDVACEPCPTPDPLNDTSGYFVPTCRTGQCTVTDIRQTDATACVDSADCHLRGSAECCGACASLTPIAVSSEVALQALVCGDADVSCVACDPFNPLEVVAVCIDGRCALTRGLLR